MKLNKHFLGAALWASLALGSSVAAAQETVRWMVCTLSQKCDLEKSSLTYSFTPLKDGFTGHTPAKLNINVDCVSPEWMRSSGSQTLESDDSAWGKGEISRLTEQKLIPYKLRHEDPNQVFSVFWPRVVRLYGKDFDCQMEDIEIPETGN